MVSSRMAWDCGVADLAAGCCSGGRMPNAGARRAFRSLAGTPWSCRTDPLSRRFFLIDWQSIAEMLENWPEPQNKEPNTTETRSAWRGRDREREKESDGVLGRARQLRLPTMAAQGGLHLRVSSRPSKNEKTRERAERYWALRFAELRPDARRQREKQKEAHRPTDLQLLA